MKTDTIEAIAEQCERIDQLLKNFVPRKIDDELVFGEEGEYSAKSLKAGIKSLMGDIRGLVRAHNKFISLSTCNEREKIVEALDEFAQSLTNEDYAETATCLEVLKILVRVYNARGSSETQRELEQRSNRLNYLLAEVEEYSQEVQGKLDAKQEALGDLVADAETRMADMQSFFEKIEEREKQLENQKAVTENYEERLRVYTDAMDEREQDAESLIQSARDALQYTTAVGISASFTERHDEYKKSKSGAGWIFGAVAFLLAAVGFGIFMIVRVDDITFADALFRLAVVSALFTGAYFCAAQYSKQKNVQEDYGYKAVWTDQGKNGYWVTRIAKRRDYVKCLIDPFSVLEERATVRHRPSIPRSC